MPLLFAAKVFLKISLLYESCRLIAALSFDLMMFSDITLSEVKAAEMPKTLSVMLLSSTSRIILRKDKA